MKNLIKWIAAIVVIIIAIVIAAPFFIPIDSVKKIVSDRVRETTGRELVVAGETKASIWPNVGISLDKVSLSNPEGYSTKNIAEIGNLTVEVALMPLLNKEVQVKNFIIRRPVINLEINKDGKANWQFTTGKNEKPETGVEEKKEAAAQTKPKTEKDIAAILTMLGNVKIEDGNFAYNNQKEKISYKINNANLDVGMSSSNMFSVKSDFVWNKEKIAIAAEFANIAQLIAGNESKFKSDIKIGSKLGITFAGKTTGKNISGLLNISSPSLVELSALSGKKMDWKGEAALAFNAKTEIACDMAACALDKAQLTLDDNIFSGDIKINFAGTVPSVEGKLTSPSLNLNNYLPKPEKQAENLFISPAYALEQSGWSTEAINLSALRSLNLDLALNIEKLLFKAASFNDITSKIKISGGELTADISHIGVYGGTAKIFTSVNANNALSLNLNASNIQMEPALKDFADFKRLSGIANINMEISGKGNSQKAIISSLSGKGDAKINDGAIKGIDLAKMAKNAKSLVTGEDISDEKTNFSELGGSFIITQGIVKNSDLAMKAPLLRVKGEGTVDLPARYVNYKLLPNLVATLQGQGGEDKAGLEIPILVTGDFEKLKFTPDLKSAAQDALKNPEKIKETAKTVKDTVKGVKETIKDPEGVKNLLKGFR